jgi:hypothetical protein
MESNLRIEVVAQGLTTGGRPCTYMGTVSYHETISLRSFIARARTKFAQNQPSLKQMTSIMLMLPEDTTLGEQQIATANLVPDSKKDPIVHAQVYTRDDGQDKLLLVTGQGKRSATNDEQELVEDHELVEEQAPEDRAVEVRKGEKREREMPPVPANSPAVRPLQTGNSLKGRPSRWDVIPESQIEEIRIETDSFSYPDPATVRFPVAIRAHPDSPPASTKKAKLASTRQVKKSRCYGCAYDSPSQKDHTCLQSSSSSSPDEDL